MTNRQDLVKAKLKALRAGVWFGTLSKVERAIMNLTIHCVENVRSNLLTRVLSSIINKILQSSGKDFMMRAEEIGQEIAARLSSIGEKWGNSSSQAWKGDKPFIIFLGVNASNI